MLRAGAGDIWKRLTKGQWLAHERRMQLLNVAGDLRLAAQIEAGAVRRRVRVQAPGAGSDLLRPYPSCCRNWFATESSLKVEQWNGGDAVRERVDHA